MKLCSAIGIALFCAIPLAAANLPAPAVTSISPASGPIEGGERVIIRGTYFQNGATVTVGNSALTDVVVESSGKITGITTSRMRGTVNVVVTNPNGASARLVKAFTYTDGTCCEYPSFTTNALTGASTQPPPSVAAGAFGGVSNGIVAPALDFISFYPGNRTSQFAPVQTFPSDANISATEVLDIDGDSLEDIALAALGGDIRTLLGGGSSPLAQSIVTASSAFAFALDSGDFDGNGAPDFVIPDHETGYVNVAFGLVGGARSSTSSFAVTAAPSGVTTGDFNNDSWLDIAVSEDEAGTVTIMLGDGAGGFEIGAPISAGIPPAEVMGLAAGYLDGDEILDLAVSTGVILLGHGDGTFTAGSVLPVGGGRHVAISDFNRDGNRDVAIDTPLTAVHVLLGDGAGGFVRAQTIDAVPGLYDAFTAFDIEGDGLVDLAIGGSPVVAANGVAVCPTITLSPSTLSGATAGQPYTPVTFTQSGGQGVTTYTLSGTLPSGMGFAGGTLSGTPIQTGDFPITVTVVDANGCSATSSYTLTVTGSCPSNFVATALSAGEVSLSWSGVANATSYQIWRSELGQGAAHVASSNTTSHDDVVASGKTYFYYVRAVFGQQTGCASNFDIATTIVFEDPVLTAGVTPVKAQHVTELRTAVNAVRAAAGFPAYEFTPIAPGSKIKTVYVHELRGALAPARASLGLPVIAFTDHPLTARVTPVRAVHLTELREGVN